MRHPVPTYFALTFAISWGGVLLVIGGPRGIPGTREQFEKLLPFAILAMLAGPMHVSLTASTLILEPLAISGVALLTYDLVSAVAWWVRRCSGRRGQRRAALAATARDARGLRGCHHDHWFPQRRVWPTSELVQPGLGYC
jgi:hypothetical protein